MKEKVNLAEQTEWECFPNEELPIPEAYIKELKYEINVFTPKKVFTFRCRSFYSRTTNLSAMWCFDGVIIDTSKHDSEGNVILKRLTYHPYIELVNVPFMVIPAVEAKE